MNPDIHTLYNMLHNYIPSIFHINISFKSYSTNTLEKHSYQTNYALLETLLFVHHLVINNNIIYHVSISSFFYHISITSKLSLFNFI